LDQNAADELAKAYQQNEYGAVQNYRNIRWRFKGTVREVVKDDTLVADVRGVGPANLMMRDPGAAQKVKPGEDRTFEATVSAFKVKGGTRFHDAVVTE
jgi:hypothetical protein